MQKTISTLFALLFICSTTQILSQVALDFNGSNNTVTTTASPVIGNQPRTVDAWINSSSTLTSQMVICDWGSTTPLGSRFTLNILNNKLRIEVGGAGVNGTSTITTGQWVHVTTVYNPTITSGANVFLYVNGSLEASGNFTGYSTLTTSTTTGFRLGARIDGISFFSGAIDEVKVYNYARTAAEVAADTVESCLPLPGLVAYFKLNEGVPNATNTGSTTAIDYTGNGNGTLNSFSLTGTASNWVPGRVRSGAPVITASPSSNICSGSTASLSINTSNSFTWSNNSTASLITVSPLSNTMYSVISTNSANCTYVSTVLVTVSNGAPAVTVTALQNPICYGASTSFSASGAATYSWSSGLVNGKSFTPTVTTVYTLTAGNACGTVSSTHTITVTPVNVTVSATPSVICTGYASTLMALSPVNIYSWTPGTTGQSIIVSPQSTTVYTVTATNGTCIGTNTLLLKTNTSPTITVSHTFVSVCQGGTISVGAAGAGNNGTYTWMPGSLTGASITTIPPGTTSYSVSGTNSLGCTSSAQIPVVVVNGPTITANASANLVCNGQTVTLTAGGAGTYTWNFGSTAASTVVNINSPVNVFTVTGTASGNSCTASQTVAVAAITPSVTFTPSVTICNGQTATLTASGATSYSWNNISSGTSGQLVTTPTITSQYTLTANTQSLNVSCLSTDFSTVTVNATPTVSAVATITTTICNGNTNTITAQGASTYTWIALNVFTAKAIVTPTGNTSYTVIGENAEGCQSVAKVQVNVKGCVGIEETAFARSIQIFPNPADETLFISSEAQLNLALYNTNGKLVRTIYTNEGTVQIDITELPAGIYLLKSMTSDQTMIRKVMIR